MDQPCFRPAVVFMSRMLERWAIMSDISSTLHRERDVNLFVGSRFLSTCAMQVQSVGDRLAALRHGPYPLGAGAPVGAVPVRAHVPAHLAGGRHHRPPRPAFRLYLGGARTFAVQPAVRGPQPVEGASGLALLRRAGAVRGGARLCRSIRLLAAALPGAGREAAQGDGLFLFRLHRGSDCRPRPGRLSMPQAIPPSSTASALSSSRQRPSSLRSLAGGALPPNSRWPAAPSGSPKACALSGRGR